MTDSKHTPGPWRIEVGSDGPMIIGGAPAGDTLGVFVAQIESLTRPSRHRYKAPGLAADANAVLIAEAPALLAGAVQLLTEIDATQRDALSPLMIHSTPLRQALERLGVRWPTKGRNDPAGAVWVVEHADCHQYLDAKGDWGDLYSACRFSDEEKVHFAIPEEDGEPLGAWATFAACEARE